MLTLLHFSCEYDTLQLISLPEEPGDDHLSRQEDKDQYSQKIFFQRTNPILGKLLDVLGCIWGGPSPPARKHTPASSTDST